MRRSALLVLLVLAACSEPRKEASVAETIPNILIPPNGSLMSKEGGEDALKLKFHSPLAPDQVATYYRNLLARPPWRLVSDTKDRDGTINLYAEQKGPPLWVTIRKAAGGPGTLVDLAGARAKSGP
ncbi:MAG TPA: hypothetical protein VNL37_06950 [Candidatus Polarisedimenticolia bacterium]|nr:hypothetical protein [Candidatus Polarisedimenticolia bacterium]